MTSLSSITLCQMHTVLHDFTKALKAIKDQQKSLPWFLSASLGLFLALTVQKGWWKLWFCERHSQLRIIEELEVSFWFTVWCTWIIEKSSVYMFFNYCQFSELLVWNVPLIPTQFESESFTSKANGNSRFDID